MDGELTITWLVRMLHVLFAAIWTGGYALLALAIIPLMGSGAVRVASGARAMDAIARLLSMAGTLTMVFGAVLIWRTRGYGALGMNEWGMIVIGSIAIAFIVMGINDSALRPALRRMADAADAAVERGEPDRVPFARAQRFAVIGLILLSLAIAFMTRALYATS